MIETLATLIDSVQDQLQVAFAVFLRIGAAMALLPGFGERMIPVRIRLVAALAFTVIVIPAVATTLDGRTSLGWIVATEIVAGLAIGALLRLFVLALQIAGSVAAQSVSLAQIFGGQAVDAQPAIGHVIALAGLTVALIAGLHVKLAEYLILSYDLLPFGRLPGASDLAEWGVERVARAFSLGFTLAAPFVITSFVYNFALGVINRAMPQLMVAFVGAPAITAGGLVLLAISLPFILKVWLAAMDGFLIDPTGAVR